MTVSRSKVSILPPERIEKRIFLLRGQKLMLDEDLAALYGVPVKALNQAVRRNRDRFPTDFMFQLTAPGVYENSRALRDTSDAPRRKQESWKHPVTQYSLSYSRLIELEARLLEKEWSGQPGLFAQMRLR